MQEKKEEGKKRGGGEEEMVGAIEFLSCSLICFSSFSSECNHKFLFHLFTLSFHEYK